MIVKNESGNLPRCLSSVKSIVDEMIVLDTGSTDDTVAIAQSFGAQVHHLPWPHDFSIARNESLKHAKGDWILVLDADEVLAAGVIPALRRSMQQSNALVINLIRQEIGAAQSPYSLVSRLFRNRPDIRFSRPYHAMIDDSVRRILQRESWQVLDLPDVAILHYGYEAGAIAQRNKFKTARLTMERFLVKNPGEPYVCSKLGALYVQVGHIAPGVELLERGLQSADEAPVLYELHYHLGIAYSRLQQPAQAEHHYRLAIQQPVLDKLKLGAYNNLGSLLKASGNLPGARQMYETTLEIDPDFAVGHYNLGMTLRSLGQMHDAIAHYQQAIYLNPAYAEAYQNLGVALLKLGRVDEGIAAFQRSIALHSQTNPQEANRLRQSLHEMGFQV